MITYKCSCVEKRNWVHFPYVGIQRGRHGPEVELRDCPRCGTTLGRPIWHGRALAAAMYGLNLERCERIGRAMREDRETWAMALWGELTVDERNDLLTRSDDIVHDLLREEWPRCEECREHTACELADDGAFLCYGCSDTVRP